MKKSKTTLGIASLLVSVFAGAAAAEAQFSTYPGISCEGSNVGNFFGAVSNTSGQSASVVCPIVTNPSGNVTGVFVYVQDSVATANVNCTLYNMEAFPQLAVGWTSSGSSSGSSGSEVFSIQGQNDSSSTDTAFLSCSLPHSTKLLHYTVSSN